MPSTPPPQTPPKQIAQQFHTRKECAHVESDTECYPTKSPRKIAAAKLDAGHAEEEDSGQEDQDKGGRVRQLVTALTEANVEQDSEAYKRLRHEYGKRKLGNKGAGVTGKGWSASRHVYFRHRQAVSRKLNTLLSKDNLETTASLFYTKNVSRSNSILEIAPILQNRVSMHRLKALKMELDDIVVEAFESLERMKPDEYYAEQNAIFSGTSTDQGSKVPSTGTTTSLVTSGSDLNTQMTITTISTSS